MRRRTLVASTLLLGLVLLAGCGDGSVYHQTRYIPTNSEEIGWGPEYYELVWQPPATDYHQPRPKLDPSEQSFVVHEYPNALFDMRYGSESHE